jgi:hypothetical protein
MLSRGGSARAWDRDRKIGVVSHDLREAPAYSIERALGRDGEGPAYVLFATLSPDMRAWLSSLREVRALALGGIYPSEGDGWSLYDTSHAFDAVVVFGAVSSSRPTATGERKAKNP